MNVWITFNPVLQVSRVLSQCTIKFGSELQISQVYQRHKNMIFLTMCMNILNFPGWEKKFIGAGEAINRKEWEREMCRSLITESGLRLRKEDEWICKMNWVSEYNYWFKGYGRGSTCVRGWLCPGPHQPMCAKVQLEAYTIHNHNHNHVLYLHIIKLLPKLFHSNNINPLMPNGH